MALVNDWRLAVRMFVRQPGLTIAAVVALALGVGLTTLLFSIGYGIFLRGLPLPEGRRIMAVTFTNVATGRRQLAVGIHDFADWRASQRSFDDLAAFQFASLNVVVRVTYRGMKAAERRTRVNEALDKVGMLHRAKHLPSQLSGG